MSLLANSTASFPPVAYPHFSSCQRITESRIEGRLVRNVDGSIEILPKTCGEIFGQWVFRPFYDLSVKRFLQLKVRILELASFLSLPVANAETISSLEPVGHQGDLAIPVQQDLSSFLIHLRRLMPNMATKEAIFTVKLWMEQAENDLDNAETHLDEVIAEKLKVFCKAFATSKITLSTILEILNGSSISPYSLERIHTISLFFPQIYLDSSGFQVDIRGIEVDGKKTDLSDTYRKNTEGCGNHSFRAAPPPFIHDLDKFSKVFSSLYLASKELALEKASEFFSDTSLARMKNDFSLWKTELESINRALIKAASTQVRRFEETKRGELEVLLRQIKGHLLSSPRAKQFQIDLKRIPETDEMAIVVEELRESFPESFKTGSIWAAESSAELMVAWWNKFIEKLFAIPKEHVGTFSLVAASLLAASFSGIAVLMVIRKYPAQNPNNPHQPVPFEPADLQPVQPTGEVPGPIVPPITPPLPVPDNQVDPIQFALRPILEQRYPSDWVDT